ncbi:MAG: mannitol dehydrogenase family protein, partial [Oscillospiraceae bacterium]|nr:mannitol dehydrogenase family protein [Oscillospiraceae bacterium]
MKLNVETLQNKAFWAENNVVLPRFDPRAVADRTAQQPTWVHFGAGNIFRAFIAVLQQRLLEQELADTGIVVAETFDHEIIEKIYAPHDNLGLLVTLRPDGTTKREIVAGVGEAVAVDPQGGPGRDRLSAVFASDTLQMASFTITEKGYAVRGLDGALLPIVARDAQGGPDKAGHVMSLVTAMLFYRYQAGGAPVALVSMDNCSHNGDKVKQAVFTVAELWRDNGFVPQAFIDYLTAKVSFPWSMIDKITPRPDGGVQDGLLADGFEDMQTLVTGKSTYIAPFVNAEEPQYLVVEDAFPAGRPPLEKAGVLFTDRDTVDKAERMKVTTCLNPLHTALAVFGCLIGYDLIADEMKDADLKRLAETIGNKEGLPVVIDPKILDPRQFLKEVLVVRLPNPFMPDTPQRIA